MKELKQFELQNTKRYVLENILAQVKLQWIYRFLGRHNKQWKRQAKGKRSLAANAIPNLSIDSQANLT